MPTLFLLLTALLAPFVSLAAERHIIWPNPEFHQETLSQGILLRERSTLTLSKEHSPIRPPLKKWIQKREIHNCKDYLKAIQEGFSAQDSYNFKMRGWYTPCYAILLAQWARPIKINPWKEGEINSILERYYPYWKQQLHSVDKKRQMAGLTIVTKKKDRMLIERFETGVERYGERFYQEAVQEGLDPKEIFAVSLDSLTYLMIGDFDGDGEAELLIDQHEAVFEGTMRDSWYFLVNYDVKQKKITTIPLDNFILNKIKKQSKSH